MPERKPRIGVTLPQRGNRFSWWCIWLALRLTGSRPVMLLPDSYEETAIALDALVLSGGGDVYPALYDTPPKENYIYDHARDAMEFTLLERMTEQGKPVLGICRGAQLMNIARGGSLHLDIAKAYAKAQYPNGTLARIFYRKPIYIAEDSLLQKLLRVCHCRVNSMHTQAVDLCGEGLVISAEEENGVVQAIELPGSAFHLGVQFHPEYLIYRRRHLRLFAGLAQAAAKALP